MRWHAETRSEEGLGPVEGRAGHCNALQSKRVDTTKEAQGAGRPTSAERPFAPSDTVALSLNGNQDGPAQGRTMRPCQAR